MRELIAYINGDRAGVFRQTDGGQNEFTYDDSASTADTPMSMTMPIVPGGMYKNKVVRPFLKGLLPDNGDTLDGLARTFHTSTDPFALLRHIGRDTAGALQLLPPGSESDDAAKSTGDIMWFSDDDFEELIADIVKDAGAWQRDRDDIRWSLAGAQPKVALHRDDATGAWGAPRDATPTTHILKPSGPGSRHDVNEFVTMRAAKNLGLRVADHDVMTTSRGHHVFVSKRYDREKTPNGPGRVHQEDLAQALGVDPANKYQSDGGPGVGEIAALFRRLRPRARDEARRRFFEALVFAVASVNTDAHTKNYSLLHSGPASRLAPLYDLGSNVLYDGVHVVESAMTIGGERRMDGIGTRHFVKAATTLGIPEDEALQVVDRIRGGVSQAFAEAADDAPEGDEGTARDIADGIARMATAKGW